MIFRNISIGAIFITGEGCFKKVSLTEGLYLHTYARIPIEQSKEVLVVEYIGINKLVEPYRENNPNYSYKPDKELLNSIRVHGILTPIVVRRRSNVILDGVRRYKACKLLDIHSIPVRREN